MRTSIPLADKAGKWYKPRTEFWGDSERYAEGYTKITEDYTDLSDRGYDIIDKVEIGCVLFVGINPSYDESRSVADASIIMRYWR